MEQQDLALERVDALGGVALLRREDLLLDVGDVVADALDDVHVVVDDAVDDRVQHGAGPWRRRSGRFSSRSRTSCSPLACPWRTVMTNASVDEHHDLAGLDVGVARLALEAQRLEHHEQRVAVELELRPLMGVDRVLDGELVQLELAPDGVELLFGRLDHPEPRERPVAAAGLGWPR